MRLNPAKPDQGGNNMTIAGPSHKVMKMKERLAKKWQLKDQGEPTFLLGMDIERDNEYIYVSQKSYITRMAAEYQSLLATYKGNLSLGSTARRVVRARARLQTTQREEDHQDTAEEEDDETEHCRR